MMDNEWNAPTPPVQALDPLSQLNAYLQKINRNDSSSPDASDVDHDEILNVVEFLFGSKTLFASLALLDDPSGGITKVSTCSAPVKRSLYLIKGSKGTQSYLCYSANENAIDYCSCRSFFDKATKAGSTSGIAQTAICSFKVSFVERSETPLGSPSLGLCWRRVVAVALE